MTDAIPIDSKAAVMEEDNETTRLMSTQKNSSEGSYIAIIPNAVV